MGRRSVRNNDVKGCCWMTADRAKQALRRRLFETKQRQISSQESQQLGRHSETFFATVISRFPGGEVLKRRSMRTATSCTSSPGATRLRHQSDLPILVDDCASD